jgi:hypothetical protein
MQAGEVLTLEELHTFMDESGKVFESQGMYRNNPVRAMVRLTVVRMAMLLPYVEELLSKRGESFFERVN